MNKCSHYLPDQKRTCRRHAVAGGKYCNQHCEQRGGSLLRSIFTAFNREMLVIRPKQIQIAHSAAWFKQWKRVVTPNCGKKIGMRVKHPVLGMLTEFDRNQIFLGATLDAWPQQLRKNISNTRLINLYFKYRPSKQYLRDSANYIKGLSQTDQNLLNLWAGVLYKFINGKSGEELIFSRRLIELLNEISDPENHLKKTTSEMLTYYPEQESLTKMYDLERIWREQPEDFSLVRSHKRFAQLNKQLAKELSKQERAIREKFTAMIKRIMLGAPALDKEIYVYRGLHGKFDSTQLSSGNSIRSSSASFNIARRFTNDIFSEEPIDRHLMRIHVPAGAKVLFLTNNANELELLVDMEQIDPKSLSKPYRFYLSVSMYADCNDAEMELKEENIVNFRTAELTK